MTTSGFMHKIAVVVPKYGLLGGAEQFVAELTGRLADQRSIRDTTRKEYGFSSQDPIILFASMNFEIKGLDDILFSLAKLKAQNHKFKLIAADKENIKKYTKIANPIISDIIFTGPLNKEHLIKMYLASDLYIMLSKFDTFGMVVLEAMAAGVPVIISNNVGAKDLMQENKNGFIINNTSDSDYVATKIAMMLDENIRRPFAAAAIKQQLSIHGKGNDKISGHLCRYS